jgi:hypothetical protein
MTGPQPLPKRVIHSVPSSAYSFNFQYILLYLRPSDSCLRLLLRLPVTYILPTIFLSITISEGSAYVKNEQLYTGDSETYNWASPISIYT